MKRVLLSGAAALAMMCASGAAMAQTESISFDGLCDGMDIIVNKVNSTALKKIFIRPPWCYATCEYISDGQFAGFCRTLIDNSRGTHSEFTVGVLALSACYAIDATADSP